MSESVIESSLERKVRDVEERIVTVENDGDDKSLCLLARAIQDLKSDVVRILPRHGKEYEGQGSKFIALGERAKSVAALVPEQITREDPGADRSAHALINRSSREMAESVHAICE